MALVAGLALAALLPAATSAFDVLGRWGQAASLVNDVLFVQGGKVTVAGQTYDSAPATNDVLYLSLDAPFSVTSPPWDYVGGSYNACSTQGPPVAYHTLSAYATSGLLLFGGEPSPGDAYDMTGHDSASELDIFDRLDPSWTCQNAGWASEPMRRIRHAAGAFGGRVWIVGGEKADGSNIGLSDHWVFDHSVPQFTQLTASAGPPDIYGHAAIMLEDGRLVVFGGYTPSTSTAHMLDTAWVLDTTQSGAAWTSPSIATSSLPSPRVNFAATSIGNGQIIIHGGSDQPRDAVYNDGWILDTTQSPWAWTSVSALSQIGGRTDHFAVHYGSQVIFGFGYTANQPADPALIVYDIPSGACVPSYTPPPTPTFATTLPGPSSTVSLPPGWGTASGSETAPSATGAGSKPTGSGTQTGTAGHSGGATRTGGSPTASGTGSGGQSSGHGPGSGPGLGPGSGSGSGSPDGASAKHSVVGIALGIVFGILGLVALVAGGYYYRRRRAHAYYGLDDDWAHLAGDGGLDGGSPTAAFVRAPAAAPARFTPGVVASIAGALGFGTAGAAAGGAAAASRTARRRDMLAEEDASEYEFGYNPYYDAPRRAGSGSSHGSSHRRPTLAGFVHGSLASLRSVGAVLGARRSREPSARSEALGEKDPFGDGAALLDEKRAHTTHPQRPRGGRQFSSASSKWSYTDPFADHAPEADAGLNPVSVFGVPPKAPALAAAALSPLYEVASNMSASGSSHSHGADTQSSFSRSRSHEFGAFSALSHGSRDSPSSGAGAVGAPSSWPGRPRSFLDTSQPPATPMRRSDSWWTRFAGRSFLDRRSSVTSSGSGRAAPFDFRDPTPAPRLGAIAEAGSVGASPATPSLASPRATRGGTYATNARHRQSASSLQTTGTADTAAAARLGGELVVVQREDTGSSTHTSRRASAGSHASTASHASVDDGAGARAIRRLPPAPVRAAPRALSVVISSSSHGSQPSERATVETESPAGMHPSESLVDLSEPAPLPAVAPPASPRILAALRMPASPRIPASPLGPASPAGSRPSSPHLPPPSPRGPRPPTAGGANVLSRIHAFERAAALGAAAAAPPSAPPPGERSTRKLEHRTARPTTAYGLVPKPELFVANPDRSGSLNSGRSVTPP